MPLDPAPDLPLDVLATPVAWLTDDGRVAGCNAAFAHWMGVGRRRVLGIPAVAMERDGGQLAAALAQAVGLPAAGDDSVFVANRRAIEAGRAASIARRDDMQNRLTEAGVTLRELRGQHGELTAELDSLRQRRSNIPSAVLAIRDKLCDQLRIEPMALPFAGELIQVREHERAWEGAIERLLHQFGISLLVPEAHYQSVAQWVNDTHVGSRLVYFRVRTKPAAVEVRLPASSVVRKLAVKTDTPFYDWIESELARRFDYACCESMDQFRREQRAITLTGQTKAGGERHEKDDRFRLDDRSRFVLGWSNAEKIAALSRQERDLSTRIQAQIGLVNSLKAGLESHNAILIQWQQITLFEQFDEQDWRPLVIALEALERERQALADSSDMLRTLQLQFDELLSAQANTEEALRESTAKHATATEKLAAATAARGDCTILVEATPREACDQFFPRLRQFADGMPNQNALTVESCDNREKEMRDALQSQIDAEDRKVARLRDGIIAAMQSYIRNWPLDARDVDVSIAAAHEYQSMLNALQADDLPRFAGRFKDLLNENTIREIAGFQSQMKREREMIRERIDTINRSLQAIDYNPNRYISLEAVVNQDAEVRDFQQDLRACTEGALTGSADEEYTEAKFLQVRSIIERFRGREGTAELDRKWTRKVSDVRNWFVFSASERWREDDREHEHYTDAGGKSGGQKEKLAYTVLAASLAYQFGIEWGETRSRTFRFVVIDEAFGRGSDESARYGLALFKRMNLQLLIVTPLQKIHIIEPYVSGLGFVHSDEGQQSKVRYLTIEEYRTERLARRQ